MNDALILMKFCSSSSQLFSNYFDHRHSSDKDTVSSKWAKTAIWRQCSIDFHVTVKRHLWTISQDNRIVQVDVWRILFRQRTIFHENQVQNRSSFVVDNFHSICQTNLSSIGRSKVYSGFILRFRQSTFNVVEGLKVAENVAAAIPSSFSWDSFLNSVFSYFL